MTSKPVAQLLRDLGVDRSHSRPRVSNDNPFSEAAFKTVKYAPVFPEAFGSLADARAFCEAFFGYFDHEHRHSGIGLHTPQPPPPGTEAAQVRLDQPALTEGPHTDRVTRRVSDCLTSSEPPSEDAELSPPMIAADRRQARVEREDASAQAEALALRRGLGSSEQRLEPLRGDALRVRRGDPNRSVGDLERSGYCVVRIRQHFGC
ncbi:hypothetical protein J2S59_003496 [Nocardioides massiliensis]|uniref:Integrase catalytic domain-containing protein n=1 Tax=Nocardioides massiliensis TaxID=1325935 RepID=A0ABT9NTE9_9ACTN|nr:integrase core domain-containing protein [Nocardioides massiliensis]MDP9823687.1 hypothetical protein [Nocardioides massiliensis]